MRDATECDKLWCVDRHQFSLVKEEPWEERLKSAHEQGTLVHLSNLDLEYTSGEVEAFEHLLERELISFTDNRGHNQSVEFSPAILQKLIDREGFIDDVTSPDQAVAPASILSNLFGRLQD
ncbi:unnamed protein product [Camellia sinensis]